MGWLSLKHSRSITPQYYSKDGSSSHTNTVSSYLRDNVHRKQSAAAATQTESKTFSIIKRWRQSFHSIPRWSISNYRAYSISDPTRGVRSLLDNNVKNEAGNMSGMWCNDKQEKEPHTIPGRNVMLPWCQRNKRKRRSLPQRETEVRGSEMEVLLK
jgi:hypothetical protein